MDDTIRKLERAAAEDPEARVHLERALDRLGRQALAYRGPQEPTIVVRPPARRAQATRGGGPVPFDCRICPGGSCRFDRRRRPTKRERSKRHRRAAKHATRHALED